MASTLPRRSFLKVGIIDAIALAAANRIFRATKSPTPLTKFASALRAKLAVMLKDGTTSRPAIMPAEKLASKPAPKLTASD